MRMCTHVGMAVGGQTWCHSSGGAVYLVLLELGLLTGLQFTE